MTNTNSNFVPIGTIIAYAGEVKTKKEELAKGGWFLCDGSVLARKEYPELFKAIETSWGAPSDISFNLPDFRGLFMRGVNGESGKDPNADERTSLQSGGNEKNLVGSYQDYATGVPKNSFTATIANNNIVERSSDAGINEANAGEFNKGSINAETTKRGGALESRPKNKYVYFLIKHSEYTSDKENVQVPLGAVIPFAGNLNQNLSRRYIICSGEGLSNIGKFKRLFEAIGYVHGKVEEDVFNIPDYRGYFLRGVDDQVDKLRDPDAMKRTSPFPKRPEGDRGNDKNEVGSVQQDATAYPMSNPFGTTMQSIPIKQGGPVMGGSNNGYFLWNDKQVQVDVATGGGDLESRPVNYNVDWYIKFQR